MRSIEVNFRIWRPSMSNLEFEVKFRMWFHYRSNLKYEVICWSNFETVLILGSNFELGVIWGHVGHTATKGFLNEINLQNFCWKFKWVLDSILHGWFDRETKKNQKSSFKVDRSMTYFFLYFKFLMFLILKALKGLKSID